MASSLDNGYLCLTWGFGRASQHPLLWFSSCQAAPSSTGGHRGPQEHPQSLWVLISELPHPPVWVLPFLHLWD